MVRLIENPICVKITIFKGHHADEVVYYRNKLSVSMIEKWRWYFEYLAALIKVNNPLRKTEQVIERSLEYELKKISLEDYKICSEPAERDPYPPYRERLHPRKHWQRKPYWLRTRSNPKKKGYH